MKVVFVLMFSTSIKSFYRYGHEKLGYILHQNLKMHHTELNNKLDNYLKMESGLTMEKASTWADRVKRQPKYCWSSPLHYININSCFVSDKDIYDYCKKNDNLCLYNGILDYSKPKDIDEFKFLIHLTQDLFQPLHIYGPFRGGNEKKVTVHDRFKNGKPRVKKMSMHALWDDYLIKKQFKLTKPEEYFNHGLVVNRPIKDYLFEIINNQVKLSCGMVYNFEDDNIYMDAYYHEEYSMLINEYLTFMKNIINKW